jgi:hypothetical protein
LTFNEIILVSPSLRSIIEHGSRAFKRWNISLAINAALDFQISACEAPRRKKVLGRNSDQRANVGPVAANFGSPNTEEVI